MDTHHAQVRGQQRGIPRFVDRLLNEFGEEVHDGHGCVRVFFSRRSKRRMERELGHQPVAMFKRYLNAFKVESLADGCVVTRGRQTRRVRRR